MCAQLSVVTSEYPASKRIRSNVGLITCFTLSICSAAYMYRLMDEIISDIDADLADVDGSEETYEKGNRLSSSQLKAVLDQRGVLYSSLLERKDIESAVNSTGFITPNELKNAQAKQSKHANMDFSKSPDAFVYRKLSHSNYQPMDSNPTPSSFKSNSIVFDSESEFIEHVEDKKDSVWLLAVASPQSSFSSTTDQKVKSRIKPASVISEEIWAVLSYRYQSFGFKTGLLNCEKLHSLCIERGFINPDLILALPKGGERMKDMVQFRPLPKDQKSKEVVDHGSSKYILDIIHSWIVSVLAERVKVLKDVRDIYPVSSVLPGNRMLRNNYLKHLWSSWLYKKPQPIHVLWLPEISYETKLTNKYQPPLVLSALSVTYTGRVRFWSVPYDLFNQKSTTVNTNVDNWPVTTSSIGTVSDLLNNMNCSSKSRFVILTPEGRCYPFGLNRKEYLSYENLEMLLHSLYPSADDFLWMLVFATNILVFINGAVEAGRILFVITHSSNASGNNNFHTNRNNNRSSVATRRSALARTVIRLARQGWTSHIPNFNTDHHSTFDESTNNYYHPTDQSRLVHEDRQDISPSNSSPASMKSLILSHIFEWIKIFLLDLISAHILLLLTILPIINILSLSYALPVVNLNLWFLRSFSLSSPIVKLRLSILTGHLKWFNLLQVILASWLFLVVLSSRVHSLMLKYKKNNNNSPSNSSRSRRFNRLDPVLVRERLNQISPDQLWNELSRLLIQSDIELKSGSADSTASSTLESDSHRDYQTCNNKGKSVSEHKSSDATMFKSNTNNQEENMEVIEGNRLLRRLRRLYHILSQQTGHLSSTSMNPVASFSLPDSYYQGSRIPDESSHVTAAHMYTWNCLNSFGNNNNNVKSSTGVNTNHYHPHTRKLCPTTKPVTFNATDINYEAEDEFEGTSDDDDNNGGCRRFSSHIKRRNVRHPALRGIHSSHPISFCSRSSSTSDVGSNDDQAYRSNRNIYSRENATLTANNHNSSASSSSSVSSNDVNCTVPLNDWPSWVVPCKECVVCWQKFRSGVRLSALPCGHGFHEHCIRKWLDTGAFDCPICRWPAYAPHLRQQCQMIEQLINAVQKTINFAEQSSNKNNN
ncbi:unnamed protein product [Trichobilharzia szidati]|nr:unnamed protein product [Trichobilharzia szidati]